MIVFFISNNIIVTITPWIARIILTIFAVLTHNAFEHLHRGLDHKNVILKLFSK